jgi:hypothetical protein
VYLAGQRQFNPQWKLDWGLGWGTSENPLSYSPTPVEVRRWLPRLGVVYTPDAATHVRFAAWQSLGMNSVGDADLAPVSVAGILQARPGDSGTISYVVRSWAVGADHQLAQDWLVAANAQTRKRGTPVDFGGGSFGFLYQNTDTAKLILQWLPQRVPLTIGLSGEFEKTNNDSQYATLDSVDKQTLRSLQVDSRWFVSKQFSVRLSLSRNWVTGSQVSDIFSAPFTTAPYGTAFNLADAAVLWELPSRVGQVQVGVRNLGDTQFQYTDPDPLNPRFSARRLVYGTVRLTW